MFRPRTWMAGTSPAMTASRSAVSRRLVFVPCYDQPALRLQQRHDLGMGPGAAEQKALAFVTAFGAQAAQFGSGLDAFGGDDDAKALAEADDGTDDRLRVAVGIDFLHEGAINLDF